MANKKKRKKKNDPLHIVDGYSHVVSFGFANFFDIVPEPSMENHFGFYYCLNHFELGKSWQLIILSTPLDQWLFFAISYFDSYPRNKPK